MDYDENADNPGGGDNGDFSDFDPYDILASWMEEKQGSEYDWSHDDIVETLRYFEVVDEEGIVNMQNMQDALKELGLAYKGFDEEAWEDIIAEWDSESGTG